MTAGAVAGVLATVPAGALIDSSQRKRSIVIAAGVATILASGLVLLSQSLWLVTLSQVASAIAGAIIGPAVIGITLGVVGQGRFTQQMGINQAYNHAGNAVGAALSGLVGWKFGLPAVFFLAVAFAIASIASVLLVPPSCIDNRAARGLSAQESASEVSGLRALLECRPLLLLAIALALFHLGNAAMLPLYGMAISSAKQGDPALLVAATIVVAQATMVAASLVAMRLAQSRGIWVVLLISFLSLPIRGVVAACLIKGWGVFPVQILDGVGAGLQSVAVPALVARLLAGSGRVNLGQGAVMTAQGVGASLSPALGGWIAQWGGYSTAFVSLGTLASGSLFIWLGFARVLKSKCGQLNEPATSLPIG